uniref:RING-type E3 ubiquitin transferase n=2 Tax=Ditylum brightwellii TaxID=49249 RepID=A0A7S4RC72_9STRA
MEDPVGCGHCHHRFCHACLQRVLSEEAGQRLFNNPNNPRPPLAPPPPPPPPYLWPPDLSAKCPCCRSNFTPQDVIRDVELQNRISASSDLVTCPFPGCSEQMTLNRVKEHEASCVYMRMRCKYASFGCDWVGPKKDLKKHEEEECVLCKMSGFVDMFRQTKMEHAHAIGHLQQQIANSNRLIHIQNNTIMMLQTRNPANLLDVIHLSFVATCHPVRFLLTKNIWRHMYQTPEARASVHNVLYIFPSFLLVTRIFFTGVRHLLVLEYNGLSRHGDYIDSLDTILLSFSLTIIGVLNLVCFRLDDASPLKWTDFQLRSGFSRPVVRDTTALAMAALHCACIEFDGERTGILVWFAVLIASSCMPRVVSSMLSQPTVRSNSSGDSNENETQHITETRARAVVLFGIRYGFITEVCGLVSTFDAILLLRLSKFFLKLEECTTAESTECFLSELNIRILGYLSVARFSTILATRSVLDSEELLYSTLFALGMLLAANRIVYGLGLAGEYLGKRVSNTAAVVATSSFRPGFESRDADKVNYGTATFCSWLVFLGCIILG